MVKKINFFRAARDKAKARTKRCLPKGRGACRRLEAKAKGKDMGTSAENCISFVFAIFAINRKSELSIS